MPLDLRNAIIDHEGFNPLVAFADLPALERKLRGNAEFQCLIISDPLPEIQVIDDALERVEWMGSKAANGNEALLLVGFPSDGVNQEEFDFLVINHQLPDMLGINLFDTVRRLGFSTPVVLMVDKMTQRMRADVATRNRIAVIERPFDLLEFLVAVDQIL